MEQIKKLENLLKTISDGIENKTVPIDPVENDIVYTCGYNAGFDAGYKHAFLYIIDLLNMNKEDFDEEIETMLEIYKDGI